MIDVQKAARSCGWSRAGSETSAFGEAESEGGGLRPHLCCSVSWVPASAGMTFVVMDRALKQRHPREGGIHAIGCESRGKLPVVCRLQGMTIVSSARLTDLTKLTLAEARDGLAKKKFSSVELTEAYLAAIEPAIRRSTPTW